MAMGITKAQSTLLENQPPVQDTKALQEAKQEQDEARRRSILETKRKMLDAMGNSKMANVFQGTEPLREGGAPGKKSPQSPLSGKDPNDAGVDISGLFSIAGQKWNALK